MNFTAETKEKIIDDMCKMIQCATVSYQDDELVDWSQYEKFQNLLRQNFPTIYQKCDFLGNYGGCKFCEMECTWPKDKIL